MDLGRVAINLKGYISTKLAKKLNHNEAYDLKYSGNNVKKLCLLLKSIHPIKKYRIECINKYYNLVTQKNGKYNENQLSKKLAFERLFHCNFLQDRTISSSLT